MRRAFVWIMLIALLLISVVGCAAKSVPQRVVETVVVEKAVEKEGRYFSAPGVGGSGEEEMLPAIPYEAAEMERMVIRRADLSLVVRDTEAAYESIKSITSELGGYVADSSTWREEGVLRGRLTVRIPAKELDIALQRFKELALTVESESISGEDVTEEYVDLQARLRNLEAYEEELLELLTEVRKRTGKADEILQVYRELTNVRGQIEQTKGRMKYLENMTALATVNIQLVPDVLARPISVGGWRPVGTAARALQALVTTVRFLVDAAIWIVFFVIPVLVLISAPFVGAGWLIRRWRRRRRRGS